MILCRIRIALAATVMALTAGSVVESASAQDLIEYALMRSSSGDLPRSLGQPGGLSIWQSLLTAAGGWVVAPAQAGITATGAD